MNKLFLLLLVLAASMALLIMGCGGSDSTDPNDIDDEDLDWHIMFIEVDTQDRDTYYSISPVFMGVNGSFTPDDVFYMLIDGQEYSIEGYYMMNQWMLWGSADLNSGQEYDVKFYQNDNLVCQGDIRMPYTAHASFPNTFNPTQSTSFSWELSQNNQYQYAGAEAWAGEYIEEDDYEEYIKNISPGARSFTVPANSVHYLGQDTEYDLTVMQTNFAKYGRNAFSAIQSEYATYYTRGPLTEEEQILRAKTFLSKLFK